ncbi:MAG: hypothetical protein M1409_09910 [Actinobacteria bacterium]|nr:hypothetical protein [Actinomycetota bacterium]
MIEPQSFFVKVSEGLLLGGEVEKAIKWAGSIKQKLFKLSTCSPML